MDTKFYIFRHGETFATKAGTGYGYRIFSADILPEAEVPLRNIGKYLKDKKLDFCVSSKFKRCRQTVGIIKAETGYNFQFDGRLNEYFLEPYWYLRRRVTSLINEIRAAKYKTVGICTHGAVIAALIHVLTPEADRQPFSIYNFPPPGVLISVIDGKVTQMNFNEVR